MKNLLLILGIFLTALVVGCNSEKIESEIEKRKIADIIDSINKAAIKKSDSEYVERAIKANDYAKSLKQKK